MLNYRPLDERFFNWEKLTSGKPPEAIAALRTSPYAMWSIIIEEGPHNDRKQLASHLDEAEDMPFWAFFLAKSYLDDVGEWPLFGMTTEMALKLYIEDHRDPKRAVNEIIKTIHPVWPDVTVIFVGKVD